MDRNQKGVGLLGFLFCFFLSFFGLEELYTGNANNPYG